MDIGLALGGGGARGGVHIGVMEILEPYASVPPQIITGTSIGGLLGAMVAKGLTLEEINDVVKHFNFAEMYSISFRPDVFSDNTRYRKFLDNVFGADGRFEDLEIPLAVVATDLPNKRAVVLSEGEIVPALLATSALPLVFPVVQHQGYQLLDGGLLNNTPFDVARARGADIVIAVDLTNTGRGQAVSMDMYRKGLFQLLDSTPTSPVKVLSAMLDILNEQALQSHLLTSPPDVLIRPQVGRISIMDFDNWQLGVEIGREAAKEALPKLEQVVSAFQTRERLNIFNKDQVLETLKTVMSFQRNTAKLYDHMQTQFAASRAYAAKFGDFAKVHHVAAHVLAKQITEMGGKPTVVPDLTIEAQIRIMALSKAVRLSDDAAFLNACRRTAAQGLQLYEQALTTSLPDDLRQMLTRQHDSLREEWDTLREDAS